MICGGGLLPGSKISGSRPCHVRSFSYSSSFRRRWLRSCARPLVSSETAREISRAISHRLHDSSKYWLWKDGRAARCVGYGVQRSFSDDRFRGIRETLTWFMRVGRRKPVCTILFSSAGFLPVGWRPTCRRGITPRQSSWWTGPRPQTTAAPDSE